MKKLLALLCVTAMLLGMTTACSTTDSYTIGVCQLVAHPALDAATQGFVDAVNEALGEENVSWEIQNAANDIPTCSTITNGFAASKVDLIMANATPALQAAVASTGQMAVKILKGESKISEMPIEYYPNPVKKYNAELAKAHKIDIPSDYIAIEK